MKPNACLWPSLLLAFTLTLTFPNFGQAAATISSGENQTGSIAGGSADAYTFDGTTGDSIMLRVGSTNFNPRVDLYAPGGALVASGAVNNAGYRDASLFFRATNSGTFTAVVSSFAASGAGTYGLRLAQMPASFVVPAGDEGGPLANGTKNAGIMSLGDLDIWSFSGKAGDTVQLRMGTVGFDPRIDLYGPNGTLIGSAFVNNAGYTDAWLSQQLTNTGTFTVVVSSYLLNYSGTYTLTLAQSPGSFATSAGDEGGSLVNGTVNAGTISLGDLDMWSFDGKAGDSIQLRMGTVGFDPRIDLYGPNGSLIGSAFVNNAGYTDAWLSQQLTNTGTFTVVVSSYLLNDSGTYTLSLAQSPEPFVVSQGDEGGALTNGTANAGTIALGDLDMWSFDGKAGDSIQLRMGTVGFDPRIDLYGPNGTLIGSAFVNNAGYTDASLSVQLTNTGTFTVVVSSYLLNDSGTYTLTLVQSPEPFVISPGDEGGALTNGILNAGTIDVGDLDMWSFTGTAGDNVELRMGAVGFDPRLDLYAPNGTLIGSAYVNNAGYTDAALAVPLTNSGTFTVVASSFLLNYSGTYTLTLAHEPGDVFVSPGDEGGVMRNGFTIQGTNSIGDQDVWSFYGTVGDSNLFRFGTVNFTPWLRLYGPNGAKVAEAVSGSSAVRTNFIAYAITNAGNYTLVSAAALLNQSGTYNLKQSRVPPDLILPDLQRIDEGTTLNLPVSAQDPDDATKPLTFTLVSAPPGVTLTTLGPTNASLSWTTTEATGPSTNLIVATVTDLVLSKAFIRTNSFTVIINEVNIAPVLPVVPLQTVNESATLTVTNTASDIDIPANPLTYTLINPPPGASIDANGIITWTPTEAQGPSTNTITTVVTDTNAYAVNSRQLSATNSFQVIVNELNTAPALSIIAAQTINESATLTVTDTATDADLPANPVTYTLINPPPGASIDANGIITWTPTEAQGPATNLITAVATDNNVYAVNTKQLSATNSFQVIVNEVNTAPTLPVIGTQTINELTTLTVTNTAADSDVPANPVSYSLINAPQGVSINANGIITWSPTEAQGPATNVITTVVTDTNAFAVNNRQLSTTNSFTVVVNEVNTSPALPVIGTQTINELNTLTVTNTATDSDAPANPVSYSLINAPQGVSIDANGVITWTPTEAQGPVTNVITTVVTDTNGYALNNRQLSATNSFTVVVNEVNTPPTLPVLATQTVNELATLSVTNTATDSDIPANPLTYTLVNPPPGVSIDANGVITWTPTEIQGPGTNTITTVVTDTNAFAASLRQLSATNSFTIIVNESNSAPILQPIADRSVHYGSLLSVQAFASDPDIPTNILTFSLTGAPSNISINATNGLITWTPTFAQFGPNTITVKVTDNGQPPLSDTTTLHVLVLGSQPQLKAQVLPGNLIQLNIFGDIGVTYELQVSASLNAWSTLAPVTPTTSPYPYIDPGSSSQSRRFYRLRLSQ